MSNAMWRPAVLSLAVAAAAACSRGEKSMARANEMGDSGNMGASNGSMSEMSNMSAGVEYTIVVKSLWTRDRFPFEYPEAGTFTGPHFSGLIGASHKPAYSIFAVGSRPTPGLERLSEEGKHSPLDAEIKAAIALGNVGALFETDPLRDFKDSLVATV